MKIYLDSDFRCYLTNDGSMREIETELFNGKCEAYIEGYRFIPNGESWTRSDGEIFTGEMIAPAEDYLRLEKAQMQYEKDETNRLANLSIPQEKSFIATRDYKVGSFISIYGKIYEVISAIPENCSIIIEQDAIEVPFEYYLEKLKEENNEETDI